MLRSVDPRLACYHGDSNLKVKLDVSSCKLVQQRVEIVLYRIFSHAMSGPLGIYSHCMHVCTNILNMYRDML